MNKLPKILITILMLAGLTGGLAAIPNFVAQAEPGPPVVVCVPASALNPAVPHDTWSGLEITLKGTAHDPDGNATLVSYTWDFGDGSPPITGSVSDPYAIDAKHIYTGSIGDLFVCDPLSDRIRW
jgi:hypothetical protein